MAQLDTSLGLTTLTGLFVYIRVALWASHVKITFIFKLFQNLKTAQNRKILPLPG